MPNNQIKKFSPKKNTYQEIIITDKAIKQMSFLMNMHQDSKGIKLFIKKSGCAGYRYAMELINYKNLKKIDQEKKISFTYQKILFVVSYQDMPFFHGVKIDFINNNVNKVFKFFNAKITKFCGCGDSFSINNN